MKIKKMPTEKRAIQELSGEELDMLVEFGKSEEFALLERLSELEKYKRYRSDFLSAETVEQVSFIKGLDVGISFIMDSVQRAKEELKDRGASEEVDSED